MIYVFFLWNRYLLTFIFQIENGKLIETFESPKQNSLEYQLMKLLQELILSQKHKLNSKDLVKLSQIKFKMATILTKLNEQGIGARIILNGVAYMLNVKSTATTKTIATTKLRRKNFVF